MQNLHHNSLQHNVTHFGFSCLDIGVLKPVTQSQGSTELFTLVSFLFYRDAYCWRIIFCGKNRYSVYEKFLHWKVPLKQQVVSI